MDPDEEARLERAAELREQIEKLKSGDECDEEPDEEPESPREFVHRKMREEAEAEADPDDEDEDEGED
jgi:hypothetical protein